MAIGTGDDAQSVVNAHGAGTTYIVKAGTHLRNFSVQPKSGDRFCGEPGAVLDGGRSLASAFSGGATNVTLDSITVRDYNPGWQGAAIQPQPHASGWVVRNVSALHNGWAGLLVADGMKILGGHYNDNDQLGIGGNAATGMLLDGLDGDTATLDGPELARNHTLHASLRVGGRWHEVGCRPGHDPQRLRPRQRLPGTVGRHERPRRADRAQPGGEQLGRRGSSMRSVRTRSSAYNQRLPKRRPLPKAGTGTEASGGIQLQR